MFLVLYVNINLTEGLPLPIIIYIKGKLALPMLFTIMSCELMICLL